VATETMLLEYRGDAFGEIWPTRMRGCSPEEQQQKQCTQGSHFRTAAEIEEGRAKAMVLLPYWLERAMSRVGRPADCNQAAG